MDTPTIATGNVVIGRVEVKGKAKPGAEGLRIISPLTANTCVWWQAEVQEEVESGSGKNKSTTWRTKLTVASGTSINVDDGSGPVLVKFDGTSISSADSTTHSARDLPTSFCGNDLRAIASGQPFAPRAVDDDRGFFSRIFTSWGEDVPIGMLGGKWRVVETYVTEDSPIYVLGSTTFDEASHSAFFAKAKDRPLYVYSGTEEQLTKNSKRVMLVSALVMLVLAFVTVAMLTGTTYIKDSGKEGLHPNWQRGPIGVVVVLFGMFILQFIRVRNRIVAVREQYQAGQRLVDIAEKKRADLIPQLKTVVDAAAAHEKSVLEAVATQRGKEIDSAGLVAIAESSPSLKTNQNFLHLQHTLADVENDLAVARGFVADAQAVFKTRVQSFPDSLVAPWLGINVDGPAIPDRKGS